ncbi:uncharacterized protein Z518_08814 [Rhinocladiella mackenziei CBS 650.93]|uniref:HNH nuclease domain-containing protein n=1 Tax=Rhinocladiella mackenziei CBS 650.93 TaxID=1442369 RepID=A0A0D2IHT9_9EURO|nr:uncharacterized protein Z518_08814 [Rhinocladiella mackenziei CBS 650.93]KIX02871.1 hypothetical protein Z518_08814 [Rhinocladiella mackenziei CBS 650.93]
MVTRGAPKIDSVDFNNEDYNVRSPERTQLLIKIEEAIRDADVSPAFWACCQLADMECLQDMAKTRVHMILGYDNSVALLPLQWSQRLKAEGPGAKNRKLNSGGQSWVQRSEQQADKHTQFTPKKGDQTQASRMIPDFWQLLCLFWDEDRVNKWKETIFLGSQNPNTDLISLDAGVHMKWTKGLFALKPLRLSSDRRQLTVQFFWQVPGDYNIDSRVDLPTEPTSSKGLDIVGNNCLFCVQDHGSNRRFNSGDVFTFTTKDPEKLPLPSVELLDMQWVLQRLVGMSSAAGWPMLDWDDNEGVDDDGWLIADHTSDVEDALKRTNDWVATEKPTEITPGISTATPLFFCDPLSLNGPEFI